MNNTFTETNRISYGGNIKNAFGGMIIGFILFIASFFILWINEGHSAHQIQIADYIYKNAIPVTAESVNRANDNKLISTSAEAKTQETLSDNNISLNSVLVLERKVEMYQWVEDQTTSQQQDMGGSTTETTTYSYTKEWTEDEVNSKNFHKSGYVNPPFIIKSQRYNAKLGNLGAFKLTETQTSRIDELTAYSSLPPNAKYQSVDGMYYKGLDYSNPQVGDVRISYSYVPSGTQISVIGEQKYDNSIVPMPSKSGNIYVQYDGLYTKDEMIEKFRHDNNVITWIFRVVGWLVMFFGLRLIVGPLVAFAGILPLLSNIIDFVTGTVIFAVSLTLSLITIGIAWFAYRPVQSIILFAVVVIIIVLTTSYISKMKTK